MKTVRLISLILAIVTCIPSCSDNKGYSYEETPACAILPTSEWGRARVILMHTPGAEVIDGVIHPAAGLYEDYFDHNAAEEEHRNYVRMLERNGIHVYQVLDILHKTGIDTLRRLARQALIYNVTEVNPRDSSRFGESYKNDVISKMTANDLIGIIIMQPEVELRSTDNNTEVEARYRHEPLSNLYFTRDQSITTPKGRIICRMNSSQRRRETDVIRICYEHLGLSPIYEIQGDGRLEGGDYIPAGTVSFIGCGMRTNQEAIGQMLSADVFGHDTVIVVKDHLRWQMEMHLDTHFNIIDKDLCTMQASRLNAAKGSKERCTADVYVRHDGAGSYTLIRSDVDFVELIRARGMDIIQIERDDELHYANNYLTIAPRHIMAVAGQSEKYQHDLKSHNVTVEWVPMENLIKGYGAAHCMTQVMSRKSD